MPFPNISMADYPQHDIKNTFPFYSFNGLKYAYTHGKKLNKL